MRPAVVLVATIAVAAAAGTAVSLAQRPAASPHAQSPPPTVAPTLPANQPAVAFGFSVAADLSTHTLVLFGGVDDFSTTWLWNGAAWVQADPVRSPPGRYGASEAYDPRTGEVLLFGGTLETGQSANDTWAWDGSTWQALDAGRGGPMGGGGSDMAWDPSTSELVLVTPPQGGRGGRGSGDELRRRRHRTRPAFELADCRRLLPVAARQDPRDPAVHVALERVGMEPAQNLGPSPRRIEHGGGPFTAASRLVWLQSRGGIEPRDVGLERT
jgi:hypothetical protein